MNKQKEYYQKGVLWFNLLQVKYIHIHH